MTERALTEFGLSIIDTFEAYFKPNPKTFVSIMSKQQALTNRVLIDYDYVCLNALHLALIYQIRIYKRYINVPPRFVPFFKPLYWVPYRELRLCTRGYNIPIDIVWMILERASITRLITEQNIQHALSVCIRQSDQIGRSGCVKWMKDRYPETKRYVWGKNLVDYLYNDREGLEKV
jgi:hypothetical protein